ncbi:hypothetical protein VTO58DRAFT_104803 [Aureobasidium pullulans]
MAMTTESTEMSHLDSASILDLFTGIHAGTVEDRKTLLVMLNKWCKQVNVYEGFDMQELTGFALARGLDSNVKFSAVWKMPQIP